MSRRLLLATCLAALLGFGSVAGAHWTAGGAGSGGAAVLTMPTGATPTTTVTGKSITVTFAQNTVGGARFDTYGGGYTLLRYAEGSSTPVTPGGDCGGILTGATATLSCTETGVPIGRWQYRVTPVLDSFVGVEGPLAVAISVTADPPTLLSVVAENPTGAQVSGPITLTWSASSGATSYNVYRRALGAPDPDPYFPIGSTSGTNYSDTTAAHGIYYDYVVSAAAGGTYSTESNILGATTITRPSAPTAPCTSGYDAAVTADAPFTRFRLADGATRPVATNAVSATRNGTYLGGMGFGLLGAIPCDASPAAFFDGVSSQLGAGAGTAAVTAPATFTVEAWFKTSVAGGKIIGFGSAATGPSPSGYDRHIYMTSTGRLVFGTYSGTAPQTVTSPLGYADGQWHLVTGTFGAGGTRLYVDGVEVAADASFTTASGGSGYWRVGFDSVGGWPLAPASGFFSGSLDEVAVYTSQLTAARVAAHYAARPAAPTAGPTVTPGRAGVLKVDWSASGSPEGYNVYRRTSTGTFNYTAPLNGSTPVTALTYTDKGTTVNVAYLYEVRAVVTGAGGAKVESVSSPESAATNCTSDYAATISATPSLTDYFRLGDTAATGTKALNSKTASREGVYFGGYTLESSDAILCDANRAVLFDGSTGGMGAAPATPAVTAPSTFTIEAWFRTSVGGGKIVGFGDARTGASGAHDRHIYLDATGKVVFGVYPSAHKTVTSPSTYRNNTYHMVTATLGPAGMRLYMNGVLVASDATVTTAQGGTGYWRVGYDTLSASWPGSPASPFFSGQIDEVAIYNTQLNDATVLAHYNENKQ